MPRLLSTVNAGGAVGIQSDGTALGNATKLNFESNRVKLASTGIATVCLLYTSPSPRDS